MKKLIYTMGACIFLLAVLALTCACGTEVKRDYLIRPVPFTDVHFTDSFWLPRMETNRKVTIPFAFKQSETTGRIDNFAIAGGLIKGEPIGRYPFDDTDIYKILEGASYSLSIHPDPELGKYLDDLIAKIDAAQEEDGYLYTWRTIGMDSLDDRRRWMGDDRWSNLPSSHELYNSGHLYEAAAAHYQATGKRTLLDIALKNAELVDRVFGYGKKEDKPGHQIIEMGLAKLYRVTGERKYLDLAQFFLDQRGRTEYDEGSPNLWESGKYWQDHRPVIEQEEAVGHAVRATYMYSGMADVATLTGNANYLKAIDRIWENVVSKKLYITGGIGARGQGEAFGDNYELPNMSAYNETCAAIGNVFWNHRLFLLHGDAKYIDVMERTLHNGLISGVSLDGNRFFYPNPLESHGQHSRSPWFGCACCPGNMTRFIASVPGYVYAQRDDILYVNMFVSGDATIKMAENTVRINQETDYPWDGVVKLMVNPELPGRFAIYVRIPGWTQNQPVPSDLYRYMKKSDEQVTIKVNGQSVDLDMGKGFARIRRTWKGGDVIDLAMPMPIRRVLGHEKVEDDRGKVALERGPIVYCAEWPDNKDGHVRNLILADDMPLRSEYLKDLLDGVQVIHGKASGVKYGDDGKSLVKSEQDFVAIPYYAWAHRGKGEMAVWLARTEPAAKPLFGPTIASTSKVRVSAGKNAGALNDQLEPENSNDHSIPYFHWWPSKGTEEWVQYNFEKAEEVSVVEVYWFDDTGIGECRVPKSWRIMYKYGDEWKPVYTEAPYGIDKDRYNIVVFETVKTKELRLEIQSQENYAGGILEWKIK